MSLPNAFDLHSKQRHGNEQRNKNKTLCRPFLLRALSHLSLSLALKNLKIYAVSLDDSFGCYTESLGWRQKMGPFYD